MFLYELKTEEEIYYRDPRYENKLPRAYKLILVLNGAM